MMLQFQTAMNNHISLMFVQAQIFTHDIRSSFSTFLLLI